MMSSHLHTNKCSSVSSSSSLSFQHAWRMSDIASRVQSLSGRWEPEQSFRLTQDHRHPKCLQTLTFSLVSLLSASFFFLSEKLDGLLKRNELLIIVDAAAREMP